MIDKFCHFAECVWCCLGPPALPLQQMIPAEGSCQLMGAAVAAAAGLSSKTLSEGYLYIHSH